jgi:hypothetical protein
MDCHDGDRLSVPHRILNQATPAEGDAITSPPRIGRQADRARAEQRASKPGHFPTSSSATSCVARMVNFSSVAFSSFSVSSSNSTASV